MTARELEHDSLVPKLGYRVRWFVRIPMRDGTELSGTLILPTGEGPFPTVFRLTPYISDTFLPDGAEFAERGYAYLCADTRGRGDSGGGPYRQAVHDADDGHDAIYWISRQDWSDGDVVLYGSSYSGTNQWLIAATAPEPLKAISPTGVSLLGFDYPRIGGILPASIFQVMTLTEGRALHPNALADTDSWTQMLNTVWANNLRLTSLSDLCGCPATMFHEIAAGALGTEPFHGCLLERADYARIKVPALSSTGLADLTCPGTLEAHQRFLREAPAELAGKSCLVLGPWEHLGLETGSDHVGDLNFGPAANLNMRRLKIDWFDWVLGRGPQPQQTSRPVYLYRAGEEAWVQTDSLYPHSDSFNSMELSSDGSLISSAELDAERRSLDTDHPRFFVCDPGDEQVIMNERRLRVAPSAVKKNAPTIRIGRSYNDLLSYVIGADPCNQVFTLDLDKSGVSYLSNAFEHPVTLMGHPMARLWVTSSAPDADLAILISALLPDGREFSLSGDLFRIRDRNGTGREEIISSSDPFLIERSLRYVSRTLPIGSRLRLVVRNGTSIRLEKNLQTATPVRLQTPSEAACATICILNNSDRRSTLALPAI